MILSPASSSGSNHCAWLASSAASRDSPGGAAKVIHQHVMIFGAAFRIEDDALEDFQHREHFYFKTCFLPYLAAHRLFEAFAAFNGASGNRPESL